MLIIKYVAVQVCDAPSMLLLMYVTISICKAGFVSPFKHVSVWLIMPHMS